VVDDVSGRRVENRSRGENGGRADEERVRDASREAVVGDVILFFFLFSRRQTRVRLQM
jgi:hypothetical protein